MSHIGSPIIHPLDSTDPQRLSIPPVGQGREPLLRMGGVRDGPGINARCCVLPCIPLERDERIKARTKTVPHAAPVRAAVSWGRVSAVPRGKGVTLDPTRGRGHPRPGAGGEGG
eukprot:6182235-Pleurochrysis_carterae.AAC.1